MGVFAVGQDLTAAQLNAMVTPTSFAPVNPSSTTSTTAKMMGLGSTITFTPSETGTVEIIIAGAFSTAVAAAEGTIQLLYEDSATQAAPANGAAVPGGATAPSNCNATNIESMAPGARTWWVFTTRIPGLVVGHTYWFDVSLLTSATADAASIAAVTCAIGECG